MVQRRSVPLLGVLGRGTCSTLINCKHDCFLCQRQHPVTLEYSCCSPVEECGYMPHRCVQLRDTLKLPSPSTGGFLKLLSRTLKSGRIDLQRKCAPTAVKQPSYMHSMIDGAMSGSGGVESIQAITATDADQTTLHCSQDRGCVQIGACNSHA